MIILHFDFFITSPDHLVLYNNQINAHALIGQLAMVYCASKPMESRTSSIII